MTSPLSISSCLRPPPPPPLPLPLPLPIRIMPPIPWMMSKEHVTSWRSRCVSTMAGVVVGATVGLAAGGDSEALLAGEVTTADRSLEQATSAKVLRWSDKRACPPWNANSLESVVPENLPRPLSGRNNRFAFHKATAPAVGSSSARFNGSSSCFSL